MEIVKYVDEGLKKIFHPGYLYKKAAYMQATEWRQKTINARCESLFEKKTFTEPVLRRRCIIPSTGYFEYSYNADKSKTPNYIYMKNKLVIEKVA